MKICYLTLCTAMQILCSHVFAQTFPSQQKTTDQGISAHVSAMGAFVYPGVKAGIDYMVINKTIQKLNSSGQLKTITKNKFITANIGFYHHRDYNTNLFLHAGYQFERKNSNGWFRSFEPQIGISRTFVDGAVYKVKDDHTVTKKKGAGHFYFSPALSVGLGKDLSVQHPNLPFSLFAKATLFANLPYNNFVYTRILGELGISWSFKNILSHSVTSKHTTK